MTRVFVFTYDRFDSITTSALLEAEGIEHVVLCHTDEQAAAFTDAGRVRPDRLHVTGKPRGLAYNRNAALDLMDDDEWALFLVDDLQRVEMLDCYDEHVATGTIPITVDNVKEWRPRFQQQVPLADFIARAERTASHAERFGARLAGFAGYDNPLFRRERHKFNVLADGRAWMVRKGPLRFDENVQMIDDVCWTVQNIQQYGSVLVDAWILPKCRRYTAGGFGSIEARLDQKRTEVAYLTATYPQWCVEKPKPGWPRGTHVVVRPVRTRKTRER